MIYSELPVVQTGTQPKLEDRRLLSVKLIGTINQHGDQMAMTRGLQHSARFLVLQPHDRKRVERAIMAIATFGRPGAVHVEDVSDAELIEMIRDPVLREDCLGLMRRQEALKLKANKIKETL